MSTTTTARPVSPKQADFLVSLERHRILSEDDIARIRACSTSAEASVLIGDLMQRPGKGGPTTTPVLADLGYYLQHDTVYSVVKAKTTGRTYARVLVTTERGRARWDYAPGAMKHLVLADKLTIDQAREMGTRHGVCVVCAATLTDPESVERGIGPVCAAKL